MLASSKFWIGMVAGVATYHLWLGYKARQASS
jgi:hypothetical protein